MQSLFISVLSPSLYLNKSVCNARQKTLLIPKIDPEALLLMAKDFELEETEDSNEVCLVLLRVGY